MHRLGSWEPDVAVDSDCGDEAPPPSSRRLEGRLIAGRYRIGCLLGSGAMGRVYRAEHVELGRTCAIKVIRDREGDDAQGEEATRAHEEAVSRFRVEALAVSRLDHPSLLRLLDFGRETDGLWYLVTEHLDGKDLVDVLTAEPILETPRIVSIMGELCSALQHAHDRGVIHRDVKPENVRLVGRTEDGQVTEHVKLLDFGTAKLVSGAFDSDALERVVIGTPAYMSPEQAAGDAADARSDVYSCGVMLYEMATGHLPFERSSAMALAAAHIECRPPAPRIVRPDIDPELESIILWCLRKKAEERPQSARALREALERIVTRSDLSTRSTVRASRQATASRFVDLPAPDALDLEPLEETEPREIGTRDERALAPTMRQLALGTIRTVAHRRRAPALLLAAAAALGSSAWMVFGEGTGRVDAAAAQATMTAPEPPALREAASLDDAPVTPPLAQASPAMAVDDALVSRTPTAREVAPRASTPRRRPAPRRAPRVDADHTAAGTETSVDVATTSRPIDALGTAVGASVEADARRDGATPPVSAPGHAGDARDEATPGPNGSSQPTPERVPDAATPALPDAPAPPVAPTSRGREAPDPGDADPYPSAGAAPLRSQ
jgi:eukaryotic-like serine/threonine-protein kinase